MYLIKSAFFAVKYNYVHTRIFVFFSVVVRVSLDIAKLLPTNFLTILRIVNSAKKSVGLFTVVYLQLALSVLDRKRG